ncbi:MAG TPA: CoA transferase [Caulobacteraceae bacterium]|jgi:crotonobetainyl-CoA:carnitine CoA-transferase CaiB-like acyl-CoA transferase
MSSGDRSGPLADVTVLEFATAPGARYCGRLFSVLGAQVVQVGAAPADDIAPSDAAFGQWLDEGKARAADIDAACRALGGTPDVVIAGQTPEAVTHADGLIERAGFDTLRLGLTWFGMEGPYADWRGDDALIQSLIGVVNGFGPAEGLPYIPQGRAPQIIAGATLFLAGAAALFGRRCGLSEQRVDVDVLEAALAFTETGPPSLEGTRIRGHRLGVNRSAANHPMSIYPTEDGHVGVTTLTPAQWQGLCQLIDRPDWAADPGLTTSRGRVERADEIDAVLDRLFAARTTEFWYTEGQKLRIPMAPVPGPAELLATPQWTLRGSFQPFWADSPLLGPHLPFRTALDGHQRALPAARGPGPLSGLRVVDFSMGWAGPLCTRHLADLGADVVKIESETHYDWWRGWEPPGASDPPEYELKMVFNVMNRGKRGVTLDLTTDDGRDKAKALVSGADIVIENYAPGVMEKLGLSHDVLQALRPGLVMVSMGAFGASGPWSHFRAYGATVEQASGMPQVNGRADWPPALQHGAYGDPVAGVYGAVAALALLNGRHRLGGAWADLAQVECLFQLGAEAIIAAQLEGPPPRQGSRHPHVAPRCVVATLDPDTPLAVSVTSLDEWCALCALLQRPDWAEDPALAAANGRNARADEIEAAIGAWAAVRTSDTAAAELQAAGVPAAPVLGALRLIDHEHLAARGTWMHIVRRHVGRHMMASPPYLIDGHRPPVTRPAPLLGEHTAEVLEELGHALSGQP